VERRTQALIRANHLDPILEHLRGLITQLRTHEIPLDYAQLARDLRAVQHPVGRKGVRVRWSRDFYRPVAGQSDDAEQIAGETT
jgi:CRISPR system Cascade subunit CasB